MPLCRYDIALISLSGRVGQSIVYQLRRARAAAVEGRPARLAHVARVVVVFMVPVRGAGHNRQLVCCKTSRRLSHIVRREIIPVPSPAALLLMRNGTLRFITRTLYFARGSRSTQSPGPTSGIQNHPNFLHRRRWWPCNRYAHLRFLFLAEIFGKYLRLTLELDPRCSVLRIISTVFRCKSKARIKESKAYAKYVDVLGAKQMPFGICNLFANIHIAVAGKRRNCLPHHRFFYCYMYRPTFAYTCEHDAAYITVPPSYLFHQRIIYLKLRQSSPRPL